jgi:hypothetical protein
MYKILFASFFAFAEAMQFASPITSEPICINKNTIQQPTPDMITVSRVAWPVIGTSFSGPVTINNVPSLSSPTIICMNCEVPPCPITPPCDVGALYWSVAFDNLVVPPGPIVLPDSPTLPEMLVTFFEPWMPSATPMPSPLPVAASYSPSPPAPSCVPAVSQTIVCESCATCPSNNSAATVGVAVAFGFVVAAAAGLCAYIWKNRWGECPYCDLKVSKRGLKGHLAGCSEHLKGWAPVITDRVRIVREPVVVPVGEREDEVARPESVAFVGAAVR